MRRYIAILTALLACLLATPSRAKVDLVTLPARDSVQLTIYNAADLTLVRDRRPVTLKKGTNKIRFSWSGTRIDPTSLHLKVTRFSDQVEVTGLSYPPHAGLPGPSGGGKGQGTGTSGVWTLESDTSGRVPVEISYFTSGLSWKMFYHATLSQDGGSMTLEGFVRVTNQSGEDYENASTRLVVGKIKLLDKIADLAKRKQPYGSPEARRRRQDYAQAEKKMQATEASGGFLGGARAGEARRRPKKIEKRAVSEFYLYSIPRTETIKHGWSKRLQALQPASVEVKNVFRHDPQRYGDAPVRLLSFTNDEEHNLGQQPLPAGQVRVFRSEDAEGHLSYVGATDAKYVPVGGDAELQVEKARRLKVEPKLMEYAKKNIQRDEEGNVVGCDVVQTWHVAVKNHRDTAATVEVFRHLPSAESSLENLQNPGEFTKIDQNTVKYVLDMGAGTEETISYEVTIRHGQRRYGQ